MDLKETKKKYEDEIARLTSVAQTLEKQYQGKYNEIKKAENDLLNEFNTELQKITIGIERLRGAYTALCDVEDDKEPTLVENGMLKDYEVIDEEDSENEEDVNINEQDEETVESELPDESIDNVESEEEKLDELKHKADKLVKEAKESGKVTSYEDFSKSELAKETALSEEEIEALKAVTENESKPVEKPVKEVNMDDVPDYLKDQYTNK